MASLIDPVLKARMLRSGAGQGLMSIGAGLMGHGTGGGPQALQQGIMGAASAMDPMRVYQAQMMQDQMEDMQAKRRQREIWDESLQSMIGPEQPALGASLIDVPGGGTEPGQVQTSMMAPLPRTVAGGYPVEFLQMLRGLEPSTAAPLLAQMYKPQKPQVPMSAIGKLQADREAGRISPEQYDQAVAVMMKPLTQVNLPKQVSDTQQTVNAILENRQKYDATGEERYKSIADKLEMELAFGGKPPESYIKARNSIQSAREGIGEVYSLISQGQADPLNFKDRAKVKQALSKAQLAYADMLNRGANFTESEQAMINAQLGGDPNDIIDRTLRGDQSYLEGLRMAGEALERRGAGLLESFTTPGIGTFQYPWQQQPQKRTQEDLDRRLSEDPDSLSMEELREMAK